MSKISNWTYVSPAAVTDTADDAAKAAPGTGQRNVVRGAQIYNNHATVETLVVIKSGSTVLWEGFVGALDNGSTPAEVAFDPPLRGGENEAINVANITTGSSTFFNLQGWVERINEPAQ
jgi:hypothetical protein